MEPVSLELQPAGFFEKASWCLELSDDGAALKNAEGGLVLTVKRAEVPTHIVVPSPFFSGTNIAFLGGGTKHEFKYDKVLVDLLRSYQEAVLAFDPAAVQSLKRAAGRQLVIGGVLAVFSWGFILTMLLVEPFRSMKEIPPTLGFVFRVSWLPALASPFIVIGGLLRCTKALRLEKKSRKTAEVEPAPEQAP